MVMVRALQKCFPNNMLRQAGEEFDHDGPVNPEVMTALVDEEPTPVPVKTKVARDVPVQSAVKKVKKKARAVPKPEPADD